MWVGKFAINLEKKKNIFILDNKLECVSKFKSFPECIITIEHNWNMP
jgi:hypothetical protein